MRINKAGLVNIIKDRLQDTEITKNQIKMVVDEVFDVIYDEVKKGNEIVISKFGKFYPHTFRRDNAYNPKTGQFIGKIEKRVFKFKPSLKIKAL